MFSNYDFLLRIRNASQVIAITTSKQKHKIGQDMNKIEIIENGTIIVDKNGIIVDVGKEEELSKKYSNVQFKVDLDGTGKSVVPGFVDGHTHPVWAGDRVHEFAMKLAGATYMDIHKMGGGIGFTVEHTRKASEETLLKLLLPRLDRMLKFGTTTTEAKSGYGLNKDAEIKMLKVLHTVREHHPVEIVSTYLGAHSVPKGSTADTATEDIITNQIPEIMKLKAEGVISPKNIDVFCEKGVFEVDNSRKILQKGKDCGLLINFHGDELNPMGSGSLGGSLDAAAISHLEKVDDEGIRSMAKKPTVAVLLPTTAYILRLEYPPARKLIDGGVPVALGSDFNPNAHCFSMPFVMHLACVNMRLTMNEALVAATLNSAGTDYVMKISHIASLELSESHGSIEVGKFGDFVVIDNANWEHLIYELVDPPIHMVIKKGVPVYTSTQGFLYQH